MRPGTPRPGRQASTSEVLQRCSLCTRRPLGCTIMHNTRTWPAAVTTRDLASIGSTLEAGPSISVWPCCYNSITHTGGARCTSPLALPKKEAGTEEDFNIWLLHGLSSLHVLCLPLMWWSTCALKLLVLLKRMQHFSRLKRPSSQARDALGVGSSREGRTGHQQVASQRNGVPLRQIHHRRRRG